MKYRKTATVDAWQFNGERRHDWPRWLQESPFVSERSSGEATTAIEFGTRSGGAVALPTNWIVRDDEGVLAVLVDEEFRARYEADDAR